PATGRPARPDRPGPAGAEEVGTGRAGAPREPDYPREEAARRLEHLQREVHAGRGAPGPEEVRRGRAAAAGRLPGHEEVGEDDPAARPAPAGRGRGSVGAVVRGAGQEGRSGPVEEGTPDAPEAGQEGGLTMSEPGDLSRMVEETKRSRSG